MRIFFFFLVFSFCYIQLGFGWEMGPLSKDPRIKPRVNLVFCALNYSDKDEPVKNIEEFRQRLSRTKPFDEFANKIGFYYIKLVQKEEKRIFANSSGIPPLKVRQDFLNDISTQLKSNYKLIILDASGGVSCAELSSIDRMSLVILGKARYADQDSFSKGFLHEFGHSFGLRDECVECAQLSSAGPPNCAATKEEAQGLWGDLIGKTERVSYIHGCCGNREYIRPTIASLMNDPDKAEDFGPVNERFLRKELSKE